MTLMRLRFSKTFLGAAAAALALTLAAGLPAAAQTAAAQDSAAERAVARRAGDLSYPPLPEFEPPQPQRVVLDNGMVVMLLEDHELPLVDAFALVRTGDRLEPADQVGLAGLTGRVLRTGGTGSMSPDELNAFLENKAASIETSIGTTSGSASLSALAKDLPEVLAVFADVLRDPAFAEEQLEVAKAAEIASIARQNDDPQSIAFREFSDVVYGESSPYARQTTYASIGAIDRDDLVAWHERYFHPNRVVLGLVGDFDSARALELVRKELGDWERGPEAADPEVPVAESPAAGVYFVDKDDMTQSNILIGHLGIRKDHPDYYAVEVVNNVLSGGFASRLFSNVRSKKGLAYAVFGGIGSNYDYPGVVQLFTTTKTETTAAAIDALLEEARILRTTSPPTAAEVERAKQSILNSFVFESDSNREILNQQLRYEYYGYPLDWLARYQKGIEAVTVDQARAAAAAHVHPDRFSILVVGPGDGMDAPLSNYGEVRNVDVAIPEPPVERAEVTAEGAERAGELLDRAVEAMGGAERVDAARGLRVVGTATQVTPQGEMAIDVATTHLFPDRFRQELTLPFGSMSMVLADGGGFAVTPQGVMDLPASQLAALQSASRRDPLALLRLRDDPDLVATALPPVELEGTPLERLQLELGGDVTLVDLDPATGEIRRVSYRDAGPTGQPGETVRVYTDYRDVDGGLRYPFAVVGTFEGEKSFEAAVQSVELDPEVDAAEFEKPEGEGGGEGE